MPSVMLLLVTVTVVAVILCPAHCAHPDHDPDPHHDQDKEPDVVDTADIQSMFTADTAVERFGDILAGMEESFGGGSSNLAQEIHMFELLESELRSELSRLERLPENVKTRTSDVRHLGNRTVVTNRTVVKQSAAETTSPRQHRSRGNHRSDTSPPPRGAAGAKVQHIWEHKQVQMVDRGDSEAAPPAAPRPEKSLKFTPNAQTSSNPEKSPSTDV